MNVFITGGTGYIGVATIAALNAAGHSVEALVRSDRELEGATTVRGTLTDLDTLRAAAARADAVIHLAADYGPDGAAVDRAAALAMLEAVDGPYVHTGVVWVYGDTDGVADEDAPLNPPAIVAWREENERAILEAGGRLIMPGLVYGANAGLIPAFFGEGRIIGDGANHWPLVHRDDIADLYVRALQAPAGAKYVGVGPGEPTLREVVEALGGGSSITLDEARAAMGPIADAFALDQRFTSERARTELGWTPRHTEPLAELADNLARSGPAVR